MTFLDIGASVGSLFSLMQYGVKVIGIELDIPQIRKWHKFLGIESRMIYMKKEDNINNFYSSLPKKLDKKVDAIFLIDTLRCIPLPTLINIMSRCLKENGTIIVKEVNPDNRSILKSRLSGKHGDLIMYSPKTISYLARRNKLAVDWYIIAATVDNLAIKINYNILRILRPPSYVAVLRREDQNDCCYSST